VYEYHGAEQQNCIRVRDGDPLETVAVPEVSTFHPRCGTSFLMTVMLISDWLLYAGSVHDFLGTIRIAHCAAAGSFAGVSYEIIRFARQTSWFLSSP